MNIIKNYIVIDDDPTSNIVCSLMLKMVLGEVEVKTFEIPEEGLAFIQNEYVETLLPSVLFLDINMPSLTGWEVMEEYEKFSTEIKKQISIYILSSSVDGRDRAKAKANQYIEGFLSKPLNKEIILSIAAA